MTTYTIHDHSEESEENRKKVFQDIRNELVGYNLSCQPDAISSSLILSITDNDRIIGGLVGRIAWDWLHVELLWIDDALRSNGYGTTLLKKAEAIAEQTNCVGVHVESFDFQAPAFYEKQGYHIFGQLEDKPKGHTSYYLRKLLLQ